MTVDPGFFKGMRVICPPAISRLSTIATATATDSQTEKGFTAPSAVDNGLPFFYLDLKPL